MESLLEQNQLCLRYCGLTGNDSVCFDHQIKKCLGICAGEENIASYNQRAELILKELLFEHPAFAILDKGRSVTEYSVILIEENQYKGFGYYDALEQISHPNELKGFVKQRPYYPDCDSLIRHFIKQGKKKIVPLIEDASPPEHYQD